jgi:hypothetical protein
MSAREQRIAANDTLFRDTYERIARKDAARTDRFEIICECGDPDCIERISVSVNDYEQARSEPTLFLAKRGHIKTGAEQVIAEQDDHQLLRKTGDAATVAEERDPRS